MEFLILNEDELILVEDRDLGNIQANPISGLNIIMEAEQTWNDLTIGMAYLEHECFVNEDNMLLEDGKRNWMRKVIKWFDLVSQKICAFLNKIIAQMVEFVTKMSPLMDIFERNKNHERMNEVNIPKDFPKFFDYFYNNLKVEPTISIKEIEKQLQPIKQMKLKRKSNLIKLDNNTYNKCVKFLQNGSKDASKRLKELEKLSKKVANDAISEVKELEKNEGKNFNVNKINEYKNILKSIQYLAVTITKNINDVTLLSFQTCVAVAKL